MSKMADSADSDMEKVKVTFNLVLNTAVFAKQISTRPRCNIG